ncbi:MAG TPA: DinB family protein [Acidobacteriaceae bacterium]|jgi:uncharacterized damage-inducible protein DinB
MSEAVKGLQTEPWMRGTHEELDPLRRAVVHALELAEEDVARWCDALNDAEMFARPAALPPVAFHLRHIARSLDRLMTYAEDRWLDDEQLAALKTELDPGSAEDVLREFREGVELAKGRVRAIQPKRYEDVRGIGRKRLPTTVGGLLIHCAEHTARHVGQAVTTVKVVRALAAPVSIPLGELVD